MHRTFLSFCLVLLSSCGTTSSDADAATLEIRTSHGIQSFQVEVADSPEERRIGLMGRESLSPVDGMAFVWDGPVQGSFWMKDTLIPLSIAFWDEAGRILEILDMEPCISDPCPTFGPAAPFVGAVELGQGAFARAGIEVGDHVELSPPLG